MNCPKCNSENEAASKFCKYCGWDLTKTHTPVSDEGYSYVGIIALMFPVMDLIMKIHQKIFITIFGYGSIFFKSTNLLLNVIWFALPVLLVIRLKNLGIKLSVIILSSILLLFHLLAISDVYNWYTFWNY